MPPVDLETTGEHEAAPAGQPAGPKPPPRTVRLPLLRKYRGPDYPAPGSDAGTVVAFLQKRMQLTEADAQARFRQATRNLLYMYSKQYLTWSKKSRGWEELPTASDQDFRVTMNYLKPILRARTQRILNGPIQFAGRPSSSAMDARDRAKLAATLVQARFDGTSMRAKLDQALELAYASGIAFLKGFWNPSIGPATPAKVRVVQEQDIPGATMPDGSPAREVVRDETGAPVYEDVYVDRDLQRVDDAADAFVYRPGDTDTAVRSVFNIRVNPDAMAFDPGAGLRWLIDTDILPVDEAREMFPHVADQIEATQGGNDALALTLERLAAGAAIAGVVRGGMSQNAQGPNRKAEPNTVIQEYWELPSEVFPEGRLVVRVGNVIAYDGDFPHGVLPYVPIFDEPAPLTPMGRPSVNDMVAPQDLINRMWTAIDKEVRQQAVGRWISWDHPSIPDQVSADDLSVIRIPMRQQLVARGLRDQFIRLDTGSSNGERWRIIQEAKSALFDIGGFHEVSRGQVPPGVDSGVAIESLREEEHGQLAKSMRAMEASLRQWGRTQLVIAKREYGTETVRYLPANREDLGFILESVNGPMLPDPEDVSIELEGFKAQSPAAFKAEVKEALRDKLIGPRKALQLLDLGKGMEPAFESEGRHYQRARWLNLAIEKGQFQLQPTEVVEPGTGERIPVQTMTHPDRSPFVLPDDDDHAIHLQVLDELALDESKPPKVRQAALALKAERRRTLDLQQADAAPEPQAGAPPA